MRLLALLLLLVPRPFQELREIRQLTRDGTHAEAYWSFDGKKIILMAQRQGDKADQIYELDVAAGTLTRISNGQGKCT